MSKYKGYVGKEELYDIAGAVQFSLLTKLGLRESNNLLDIGCGSLRAGKLFIPYLNKGNYFGIEPNEWLINEAIQNELGNDILTVKKPVFLINDQFELSRFSVKFDYILAQSIFTHATKEQIENCLQQVVNVLCDDGVFALTFVVGSKDYEGDKWVYPDCNSYTPEYIKNVFNQYNLRVVRIVWPHPGGLTWYIAAHKNYTELLDISNMIRQQNKFVRYPNLKYLIESRCNNRYTRKLLRILDSQ